MPLAPQNVTLKPAGDQVHTAFLRACGEGQQASRLAYLLKNGADIEHRDDKNCTSLHHAAFGGSADTVQYLLDAGADLHAVASWCGSALCLAALRRHHRVVEVLLKHGAKVNRVYPKIGSAAHAACAGGDMAIIRTLIDAGADFKAKAETCIDAYDDLLASDIETMLELPLHCRIRHPELRFQYGSAGVSAAERGFCEVVRFLLHLPGALSVNEEFLSGAPRDATDRHSPVLYVRKATLIMMAASRHGPVLLNILLSRGANPTALDNCQSTAIDYLCRIPIFGTAQYVDPVRCMVTLFDHGVDVNASDRDGSTALMLASLHGTGLDVVNLLLDHGADVNAKNKFGNTALTLTVERGRKYRESGGISLLTFVDLLCKYGANTNHANSAGRNALAIAQETPAWSGQLEELKNIFEKYETEFRQDVDTQHKVRSQQKGQCRT